MWNHNPFFLKLSINTFLEQRTNHGPFGVENIVILLNDRESATTIVNLMYCVHIAFDWQPHRSLGKPEQTIIFRGVLPPFCPSKTRRTTFFPAKTTIFPVIAGFPFRFAVEPNLQGRLGHFIPVSPSKPVVEFTMADLTLKTWDFSWDIHLVGGYLTHSLL